MAFGLAARRLGAGFGRSVIPFVTAVLMLTPALAAGPTQPPPKSAVDALKTIIERLRGEGSLAGLCDYVDWQTAYQRSTQVDLAQKSVSSAKELENYYRMLFGNAPAFVREQIARQRAAIPKDDQQAFDEELQNGGYEYLLEEIETSHKEIRKNLKDMTYSLGEPTVIGDRVQIPLHMELRGVKSTVTIELANRGGRWLFPSLDSLDEAEQALGPPRET